MEETKALLAFSLQNSYQKVTFSYLYNTFYAVENKM